MSKDLDAKYLNELDRLARAASRRHKFAWYEADDIYQECYLFGLKAYAKWDPHRPPGPYIRRHLSNKLRNLHRDNVTRNEPPCRKCATGRYADCPGAAGPDGCKAHQGWAATNGAKACLAGPAVAAAPFHENTRPADCEERAEQNGLAAVLDKHLKADLRTDYLRMLAGADLPDERSAKVRAAVKRIIKKYLPTIYEKLEEEPPRRV